MALFNFNKIVAILKQELPGLIAVYVYGSQASNQANLHSDIDIAFLTEKPCDNLKRYELANRLAMAAGRDADLLDLRATSTVMRMQVISKGQCLFDASPQERGRFEDYVFSSYARLNEERRGILEDVQRRGTVYG